MEKTKLDLVKNLSARLRGPRNHHGEPCSPRDTEHVIAVQYLWCILWVDIQEVSPEVGPQLARIVNICKTSDVYELYTFCTLVDELLKDFSIIDYVSFKEKLRAESGPYMCLIGACKTLLERWFRYQDIKSWHLVHCFFSFPLRTHISDSKWLREKAVEDWLATQERCKSSSPTHEEREIIAKWFPLRDERHLAQWFNPQFGSGSSKEGKALIEKYRALTLTPRMVINHNHLQMLGFEGDYYLPEKHQSDDLSAKILFVPKSYKSFRSVTLEPSNSTYMQYGWANAVWKYLRKHCTPFSRRYCICTDVLNAELAQEGSICGSYATIDLSSASDSVTRQHADYWFSRSCLNWPLRIARTSCVELPDGRQVHPSTSMGMGARMCFVIETIAFAALAHCAIASTGDNPDDSLYRVYGDDIVIESKYAEVLIERLERNGFIPNRSKSFYDSVGSHFFRESCGGEYLDGVDVTPIRIPRVNFSTLPSIGKVKPSCMQGLVDLANTAYNMQFPLLRSVLLNELRNRGPLPLFSPDGEGGGLFSRQPTNYDKDRRWNEELQRDEILVSMLDASYARRSKNEDDTFRFMEWCRSVGGRSSRSRLLYPEDRVDVRMRPPKSVSWHKKFVPAD